MHSTLIKMHQLSKLIVANTTCMVRDETLLSKTEDTSFRRLKLFLLFALNQDTDIFFHVILSPFHLCICFLSPSLWLILDIA